MDGGESVCRPVCLQEKRREKEIRREKTGKEKRPRPMITVCASGSAFGISSAKSNSSKPSL